MFYKWIQVYGLLNTELQVYRLLNTELQVYGLFYTWIQVYGLCYTWIQVYGLFYTGIQVYGLFLYIDTSLWPFLDIICIQANFRYYKDTGFFLNDKDTD